MTTMAMWSDAMRALEHELMCPECGEQNSPNDRTNKIHVDHRGEASCDACGHGAPLQTFKRRTDR